MDSVLHGRPVARDLKGQYYAYVSNGGLRGATAPSYNDVEEVEGEEEGAPFGLLVGDGELDENAAER